MTNNHSFQCLPLQFPPVVVIIHRVEITAGNLTNNLDVWLSATSPITSKSPIMIPQVKFSVSDRKLLKLSRTPAVVVIATTGLAVRHIAIVAGRDTHTDLL